MSKRAEVTEGWRKLHNEKLHNLHDMLNIIRVIESRKMRWAARVAHMWETKVLAGFWWVKLKERDYLEILGVDGKRILK
jgi:hypothetical protein